MKTISRVLRKIIDTTTRFTLIFIELIKIPLANNQTLIGSFARFRLQVERYFSVFANEKPLYFKCLPITRLQYRLQICQLSSLTSLQVQAVSFAVFKEKMIDNQSINKFLFARLFAIISKK